MFYQELIENADNVKDDTEFNKLKIKLSKKYNLGKIPTNIEILCNLNSGLLDKYKKLLLTKPTRTISGVAPVAIMTKPFPCPWQAKCTFCPGGPNSYYGDTPKSYPGGSPAHKRAERNKYDPYLQVFNRLEHYALLNQDFSKIELIIMGGTFTTYPKVYRDEFITYALKAMNDFSDMFFINNEFYIIKFKEFFELPSEVKNEDRTKRIHDRLLKMKGETGLQTEQRRNETSNVRCVTFCIETRPDYSKWIHIDDMLRLGATRIELGIQSIYDNVLLKVERGHLNDANIKSTQLCKDSFLKVGYHVMLGLPDSTEDMDIEMFKEIFSNQDYKPDALKIYPCMVFKGTKLYEQYLNGEFKPIDAEEAAERIVEIKRYIPRYCRIMRVQRDIPTYMVEAGVERTNLRQEVMELMRKKRMNCNCIRCREPKNKVINLSDVKLKRYEYESSNGQEIFLSFDDVKQDLLLGFVRLRVPYKPYRREITERSAGIREIHVYGSAVNVNKRSENEIQHKGIGTMLIGEAEKIAIEELDADKMLIISGIGVREYFKKKFNYKQDGPYVSKELK